MSSHSIRAIATGCAALLLFAVQDFAARPASAQALRARSSDSVAAGAPADRNAAPTSARTGLPGVTAQQTSSSGAGRHTPLSILGMPLRIAAPVAPAYNGNAIYSTFAGQPMTGKEVILQQSIDGAP
ncbi:hypothetical protein [Lichenicoccus sp.]|uniref:hypothetical protein n=1 Tax=Lichenicoccus sp. TaxID=2781899 RepID=UPI003D0A0312